MIAWTYLATIESESEPGKTYDIKRRSDGTMGCGCVSYRFDKAVPKSCKHLRAFGVVDLPMQKSGAKQARVSAPAFGDEVFTVTRRGISFSNDLGPAVAGAPKPPSKAQELAGRLRTHAKTGRYTRAIYGDLMAASVILEKLTD